MSKPIRIQRMRTPGWRMPPNTIYVGRPTIFGNDYRIGHDRDGWWCWVEGGGGMQRLATEADARFYACTRFRLGLTRTLVETAKQRVRGHNLACWCCRAPAGTRPIHWCHADIWLEIVNG